MSINFRKHRHYLFGIYYKNIASRDRLVDHRHDYRHTLLKTLVKVAALSSCFKRVVSHFADISPL